MTHKLYTRSELQEMQGRAELALAHSELLETQFADRFEMADRLFKKLDSNLFVEINSVDDSDPPRVSDWHDENIPDKSFAVKHEGSVIGFDIDTMIGPNDWYTKGELIGDRVTRRKCYVYNWTAEKLQHDIPELKYFTDLHAAFVPVLEHYMQECFADQLDNIRFNLYKLMIIEYSHPTANDDNIKEHRAHNTERFGDIHCDETLGGLHLGENYVEFYVENHLTGERKSVTGLDANNMLWFFGEHSERSGWQPSMHGMQHNPADGLGTRYSIIFDLQARYKGEE
jgi:hypothetical protein